MAVTSPDPWAIATELPRVFLLEYRGRAERRALSRWVEAARARGGATVLSSVPLASHASQVEPAPLARFLEGGGDCFLVPLRAVPSGKQLEVVVAEGATLAELSARLAARSGGGKPSAEALARFIRRQAVLALERAERNLRGARYKIPRLLEEEVLERPRLLKALAEEAEASGRSLAAIQKEARACLHEMAPRFRTRALDLMASLGRYLYTRGFDREVDVLPEDLARVRALSREYPVAFLMTHKSHLDGFLLITLFYDLDLPPVHVFGGINMSFFGLGALGKHSGAIFIRRTMSGDNVYKAVFKQYIDYLAEKRFPLLWALEGTRSRTGKLMPPRYGLINYVVDSYARAAASDMVLMPVSIAYDQVPEVGDYIAEQKGITKRPESASWFLQYVSGLRNPFGRIHVRFGEGLKLSEVLGEPRPGMQVTPLDVQKIAFRLSVDANAVTPVLGTSLIAWVLCGAGRRALTRSELAQELRALTRLVRAMKLPTSGEIEHPSMEALERVLGQLVHTGVLARHEGAREPLYAIAPEATMAAAYYRNAMVHFLVAGAIGELALLEAARGGGEPRERLYAAALRLRDLLKFEFFFHEKPEFLAEMERDLERRVPDWEAALAAGPRAVQERLAAVAPLLAPGTLRPFLESYLMVAEALLLADAETAANPKGLTRFCMRLAGERALQGRIGSAESAGKAYLENGLLVARARGLAGGADAASRQAFHDELAEIARDIALLAAMTENRRLGHAAAT